MVELVVGVCLGMVVVLMFWLGYVLGFMNGRHRGRTENLHNVLKKQKTMVEATK